LSQLQLERVSSPRLKSLSGDFGPGVHVLLGAEADGTADLIELCAGVRLPQRGRLSLDGVSPGASPQARRRIASLLADEGWPGEGDVQYWIGHLGALRGFDALPATQRYCPDLVLDRPLQLLSSSQRGSWRSRRRWRSPIPSWSRCTSRWPPRPRAWARR